MYESVASLVFQVIQWHRWKSSLVNGETNQGWTNFVDDQDSFILETKPEKKIEIEELRQGNNFKSKKQFSKKLSDLFNLFWGWNLKIAMKLLKGLTTKPRWNTASCAITQIRQVEPGQYIDWWPVGNTRYYNLGCACDTMANGSE